MEFGINSTDYLGNKTDPTFMLIFFFFVEFIYALIFTWKHSAFSEYPHLSHLTEEALPSYVTALAFTNLAPF